MEEMIEKIAENTEKSFGEFRAKMLDKTKEEIFGSNYEIRFYDEMKEFFTGCGTETLKEHTVKVLAEMGTGLLRKLYDEYLSREYASINSWDDICEWLDMYAENLEV